MKNLFIIFSILFYFSCSAAEQVISALDVDKVITNSDSYNHFKASWDRDNAKYKKELEHYESKMIDLDKKIISQTGSISTAEIGKMKSKLEEYETAIQRLVEDRKNKLDSAFSQALFEIKSTLLNLVAIYSQENGISMVLPKSQIIYNDNVSDITDKILEALNSKLNRVSSDGNR
jgi:Skp family chaperone for outer membrane proteins